MVLRLLATTSSLRQMSVRPPGLSVMGQNGTSSSNDSDPAYPILVLCTRNVVSKDDITGDLGFC